MIKCVCAQFLCSFTNIVPDLCKSHAFVSCNVVAFVALDFIWKIVFCCVVPMTVMVKILHVNFVFIEDKLKIKK